MFTPRPYQVAIIEAIEKKLLHEPIVALCAACASGKTAIVIAISIKYEGRVLVLAHGRTSLREQHVNRFKSADVDVAAYDGTGDIPNTKVVVAIPQSLYRKDLPQFDLVIIDEAHHFYHAAMVQKIIQRVNPKHQLLLTGSAAKFVKENFSRVMYSAQELWHDYPAALSKVTTFVVQTAYDYKNEDYTVDSHLKSDIDMPVETTEQSLDIMIWKLINILRKNVGDYPLLFNGGETLFQRVHHYIATGELGKTIIATGSIVQANQVQELLTRKGIKTLKSTSENDKDSEMIDAFKSDNDAKILVVVDRGTIGFDMPELRNFIDMTGTENPDSIFQMIGRVSRNDFTGKAKVFIKAAPLNRVARTELVTCFSLALLTKELFNCYTGDYMRTPFPSQRQQRDGADKEGKRQRCELTPVDPECIDLTDYTDMLLKLQHRDDDSVAGISWISLSNVFGSSVPVDPWTIERCKEDALNYKRPTDWQHGENPYAYIKAHQEGWFDVCCAHMDKEPRKKRSKQRPKGGWTLDNCIKDAQRFTTTKEWYSQSKSAAVTASRNKWWAVCTAHMIKRTRRVRGWWTLERCVEDAQAHTTQSSWRKANSSAFNAASKNGWLQLCCRHMKTFLGLLTQANHHRDNNGCEKELTYGE